MSQHLRPQPRSKWRRKVAGVPVFGWAMATTLTAAAVVGFIVLLGTGGSVSSGDGIDIQYEGQSSGEWDATATIGTPTCGHTWVSVSRIDLEMSDALPGDQCRYRVPMFNNPGAATAVFNGYKLDSADFAGGEIVPTVNNCGTTLTAGNGLTVTLYLTATEALTTGSSFTLAPAEDGFDWRVDSLYNAGECNSHT